MNPSTLIILLWIAASASVAILAYDRGATAGNRALELARKMRSDILDWVALNWKDEKTAYNAGVASGYQQGLAQADALFAEHDQ